jgi:predicted DsbA family dithiol-disulfide isomerase
MYDSTITFTLDTICPWTYLAKKRLSKALDQFRESHHDAPIKFDVQYAPYQLYPEASVEGEDKYMWYKVCALLSEELDKVLTLA